MFRIAKTLIFLLCLVIFTGSCKKTVQNIQEDLVPKWVFSGGLKFDITEYSMMTIQADYTRQGKYNEIIGGGLYGIKLGNDAKNPDFVVHGGAGP